LNFGGMLGIPVGELRSQFIPLTVQTPQSVGPATSLCIGAIRP
jgi:hypothetical protein